MILEAIMELQAAEVIDEYKNAVSELHHQLLMQSITVRKLEAENGRMREALEAPPSTKKTPVGPRVPAASANGSSRL
jgi:hypothetical protein